MRAISVRIPPKVNADSEGNANGIPGRRRTVHGAHRRWLLDCARSVRLPQEQPIRSCTGIDVARIVKKLANRTGLDAAKYAGHSLRAGHATSAAIAGASERSIMHQTGHRSAQMVRWYIREGNPFRDNSAGKLGL